MNEIVKVPDPMQEMQGVVGAARDAMTDEMIARLAGSATDSLALLDQLNRAGVAKALPVLADLINNGDLQRIAHLARVVGAGEDALTDPIVERLVESVSGGLALVDQVHRSGFDKALPIISKMAADGDLERLAEVARVYGAAQDALTDEMIGRMTETFGEGLSLVDRLHRGGAGRLVEMLERLESSGQLERVARVLPQLFDRLDVLGELLQCVQTAAVESKAKPATGGIGSVWGMLTDARNQQALQFMLSLGRQMQEKCAQR
jgi:uncharacterized protein YjgD (DUF1641 family)